MNIAIITGASSGMGVEFVRQLDAIANLDEIWMIGRNEHKLQSITFETKALKRKLSLDLLSNEAYAYLKYLLTDEMPCIRMLINCAGFGLSGNMEALSGELQTDMIDLNCKALTRLTMLCLPYMQKGSRIIQMASAGAFVPQPGFAVYAASKAYVLSLGRALHAELYPKHIYVTTVCPGPVDTPFFEVSSKDGKPAGIKKYFMVKPDKVVKHALKASILKKELAIYGISMKALYVLAHLPLAEAHCAIQKIQNKSIRKKEEQDE